VLFYILRLGFLDGYAGYVYGRLLSQYEYQIGVKLYELNFGGRLNKVALESNLGKHAQSDLQCDLQGEIETPKSVVDPSAEPLEQVI
jgi:hypothetical protein